MQVIVFMSLEIETVKEDGGTEPKIKQNKSEEWKELFNELVARNQKSPGNFLILLIYLLYLN